MAMLQLPQELANELAERAIARCLQLAALSEFADGILRQYLSEQHKACNQQVAEWMAYAGMQTWQDEVGNQWGRLPSQNENAKRLIIGSHLDTVPNAGAYDGILGVILGIELAGLMRSHGLQLPFHLDVVGFCDEEGTRFATTLIGSKALAGDFDPDWLHIADKDGIFMADAMAQFGLDPNAVQNATLDKESVLAYWEVHIEQGPVLEAANQPIGVVNAIAGAKRAQIDFKGKAGHAGTTPMRLRSDALTAASEFILDVEAIAGRCRNKQVATVGQLKVKPGATNVIAGHCTFSLDVRAQSNEELLQLIQQLRGSADEICQRRGITYTWQWIHQAQAVECNEDIKNLFYNAALENGFLVPLLPSGAGHDAMAIAPICPVGMLFIRSPGGLSHHPNETVIEGDVAVALSTLFSALTNFRRY